LEPPAYGRRRLPARESSHRRKIGSSFQEAEIMERWWCMDCKTPVTLDKHGRCDVCESEAVDLIERIQAPVNRNLSIALTVTNALQSS
jgi:hypothetical protein